MASSPIFTLPEELLESIIAHLPPRDTIAFGETCKRNNKVTYEPLVWRRHCIETWRYWHERHHFEEKLQQPPVQVKWRLLFEERHRTDKRAIQVFEDLLQSQQGRVGRMEDVAALAYDVKDLLLQVQNHTPDDAPDVLARRYHANTIMGQIHRATALAKWSRLQKSQMVRLEEVLGSYDLFAMAGGKGDLNDIDEELDRIAADIRAEDADFEFQSTRKKAIQIAEYLRSRDLIGNTEEDDYHALRNNFISIALFTSPHTSLPLISVAIYCAVARRLGVNARPSNYPHHVHAVIESPADMTLDGARRVRESAPDLEKTMDESRTMHMDPWRTSTEVPRRQLSLRLSQMGAPEAQHAQHLGAATNMEMALRTGRNIMNSVQEARDRQRGYSHRREIPDIESSWYSMLWSMLVLGDASSAATLHRRRQCLPYLIEHYQAHFPEDLGMIERVILPMFEGEREHHVLLRLIADARSTDQTRKAPSQRPKDGRVAFKVGTHFQHKRYGYEGVIVGWDVKCTAEQRWIEQMRVDDLAGGREQPFYNVVADDKSVRYVAAENIVEKTGSDEEPSPALLALAGRYFKKWDASEHCFVSNIRDEYPDD